MKSDWEDCQVVKKGSEYHGRGEEYSVEDRKRGSNIIFSIVLRLLVRLRITSGEEGQEGTVILWRKIEI